MQSTQLDLVEDDDDRQPAAVLKLPGITALRDSDSTVSERTTRGWTVLTTGNVLGAGGTAEEFEQRVLRLVGDGHRRLVADLKCLTKVDHSGIAALARCRQSLECVGGAFRTAGVSQATRARSAEAGLDLTLLSTDSVEVATTRAPGWNDAVLAASILLVTGSLVALGLPGWRGFTATLDGSPVAPGASGALVELARLVAAALIGFLVTAVHKRQTRDRAMTRSMEQAQVLLCVSGAMMMIIIGSSLARAFGIAGAAGIVRFRTPVDDPKDVTILFLLMGLGMACGIGALPVAGLGTLFLCIGLVVLDQAVATKPRTMHVEITASGREFPAAQTGAVFARHGIVVETREVAQERDATVSYSAAVPPGTSIEQVTASLARCDPRVLSVAWNAPKRG